MKPGDVDLEDSEDPVEFLRRGTTDLFALDAENELSYSKMQMMVDQNHPRLEVESKGILFIVYKSFRRKK